MSDHISSAYDRDLEEITTLIIKMGGLVEDAITNAARSLADRDVELADAVREADKAIDALEEQINEEAARTIALRAPVSKDSGILALRNHRSTASCCCKVSKHCP